MRLHRFALAMIASATMIVAPARSADDIASLDSSLKYVPADVSFYTTSLRLGEQMDLFLKSNAYAKLRALPAAKLFVDHLRQEAAKKDSPFGHMMEMLKDPANQELVALLKDLPHQEIFVYGGSNWAKLIPILMEMNNAQRFAPLTGLLSGVDPSKSQARAILGVLNNSADKLEAPELVFGFRISKTAPAIAQIKRLEEHLTQVLAEHPQLKGRLKRTKVSGVDALSFTIDGSMFSLESIPWKEIEEQEGEYQKLRLKLKSLTLAVTLLVKNDYLLLTVGPHAGMADKFGTGPALATRAELSPMAKFLDRKIVSVGYASQALAASVETTSDDMTSMLDIVKAGLDKLQLTEQRRQAIEKDLKQLLKEMIAGQPKPGAAMAFAFLSPRGQESYSYDYTDYGPAPEAKPLGILNHVGGTPLLAFASHVNDPTPGYKDMVKWLKIIYGHADAVFKELRPDQHDQFKQGMDMVLPFLRKFDDITGTMFLPALGTGESAFVVDAKWTSKKWFPRLEQDGKVLPMLELALVRTIKDSPLLMKSFQSYRDLVNEILVKVGEFGVPAPEKMPAPEAKKVTSGTLYFWPLPPMEQDEQLQPNAGFSDKAMVLSVGLKHSENLLTSTPLKVDGGPLAGGKPLQSGTFVNIAGFFAAVRPWVIDFGLPYALENVPDNAPPGVTKKEIPDQVRTLFDVLGCLRMYSSATYREGAATVTHGELVIQDLK